MKRIANYIGFLIVITTFFSCNNSSTSETPTEEVKTEMPAEKVETEPIKTNNVVESSNEIGQITIGNQIWSTKNLDVSNFRNGDIIPEAKTDEEWAKFGQEHQPAWCYYDNDPENGKMYGKLYNWYAVNDARGLAPQGWHIPTSLEHKTFLKNLKDLRTKIEKQNPYKYINNPIRLESLIINITEWNNNNEAVNNFNSSNQTGFSALPGGYRNVSKNEYGLRTCKFQLIGNEGFFWCFNESSEDYLTAFGFKITCFALESSYASHIKDIGKSVRCIKD
jgi:uncharacterized protein (TIGR02145 family)